ncbi:MAG TPA: hypothetical protein VIM11_09590 [Tepidisphaeraceae bacterium]
MVETHRRFLNGRTVIHATDFSAHDLTGPQWEDLNHDGIGGPSGTTHLSMTT